MLFRRIRAWERGYPVGPSLIQIHLSNRCNLNCVFCPTLPVKRKHGQWYFKEELTTTEWLRVIREGNKLGAQEWHLCGGGEPLIDRAKAEAVMTAVKSAGKRGEIIQNGTLWTRELIEKTVNIGWDKVTFSLDASTPELIDRIRRGRFVFEKVIDNISFFNQIKRKRKTRYPELAIHAVLTNETINDLVGLSRLANKLRCTLKVNMLNVWDEKTKTMQLTSEKAEENTAYIESAIKEARKNGTVTNLSEIQNFGLVRYPDNVHTLLLRNIEDKRLNTSPKGCYYPWYNLAIFADGAVSPCFLLKSSTSVRNNSLRDIWEGPLFEKIRTQFKKNKLSSSCKNCNAWNVKTNRKIREFLVEHD